jgi:hypothetical protein
MEIRVTGDEDAVFQFLGGVVKQDEVFVRGLAGSVIVNEGNECMKGLVVELDSSQDIDINL